MHKQKRCQHHNSSNLCEWYVVSFNHLKTEKETKYFHFINGHRGLHPLHHLYDVLLYLECNINHYSLTNIIIESTSFPLMYEII